MIKISLKGEEECDTYQSHICQHPHTIERLRWKHRDQELSVNNLAFISCRSRLYFYTWWKPQCWLKAPGLNVFTLIFLCCADVYRYESGRCCTLLPFLTYFLSFHLSRFSFYINIYVNTRFSHLLARLTG